MSAIQKLFEALVADELMQVYKNLIIDQQHGFALATSLAVVQDYLVKKVEDGGKVDEICIDISKAFDSVSHELLCQKLKALGIVGNFLDWLASSLCNRRQFLLINGVILREVNVLSGVPKESHIGPILFLFFVNDICRCSQFENICCMRMI